MYVCSCGCFDWEVMLLSYTLIVSSTYAKHQRHQPPSSCLYILLSQAINIQFTINRLNLFLRQNGITNNDKYMKVFTVFSLNKRFACNLAQISIQTHMHTRRDIATRTNTLHNFENISPKAIYQKSWSESQSQSWKYKQHRMKFGFAKMYA